MDHEPGDPVEHPLQGESAPQQSRNPLPPTGGHQVGGLSRRYCLLELLGVFLTLFAAELVFRAATGWVLEGEIGIPSILATGLTNVGYCLLIWILLTRRETFDWRLPFAAVKWAQELGWALLLLLAISGCAIALALIIFPLSSGCSTPLRAISTETSATLAVLCLSLPIVSLGEELLFRVYVQTRLTRILGGRKVLPVILGAVLFAAVHGYPWTGTLVVGVIGLVLGVSYQANGKIPRLVIAHTLWNLMVTLLPLVPDGVGPDALLR
jgi:membrane protease YdiL (CAAX protease family)